MLIKDVLNKTTQFLKDKGSPSARLDTELLIATAMKWDRVKLYMNYEYPLSEQELAQCRDFVRRRAGGEPVAYILGHKDFYNHSFKVSPAVLVPRPETELLVEQTVEWLSTQASEYAHTIVDLGTGSGCIGLSIVAEDPDARLLAVDLSSQAIDVASFNAEQIGVADRVTFMVRDAATLTAAEVVRLYGARVDAVVANPPYIDRADPAVESDVRKFEPEMALFSDESGLSHLRSWSRVASEIVRAGGWVMFEIGHEQGSAAREIFESVGTFDEVQIIKDLSGRDRFVRAIRSEES